MPIPLNFEMNERERKEAIITVYNMGSRLRNALNGETRVNMANFEEWRKKFEDIRAIARPRSIEYFSDNPSELEELIKEETISKVYVVAYSETMEIPNYVEEEKSNYIKDLSPYLEILKSKLPKSYHNVIKFIDDAFDNRQSILAEQQDKDLLIAGRKYIKLPQDNSISPLAFMFNGKALTALGRAKTRGKIDKLSSVIKIEGVNLFTPKSTFKIGVGTAKIFRYAVAEFTKRNHQNATENKINYRIFLDVKDFAQANGINTNSESAMKNFRFKLRKNLETLRSSGVTWDEKIKGKSKSFSGMNYIGKYELKGNSLEIEFTVTMAEYLTSLPLIQYPRTLYQLDDQDYNAFAIGEAMCIHYSQNNNVIQRTEGKLKVETLLKYTSFPTWDELKQHKWSWEDKVKEPFERALDKLTQCGFLKDWEYQYEGGIKIPDDKAEFKTYREFISLLVKFELNDFQAHQLRAIEIKKKKEEQIKKLQTKRKNYKKTDDNITQS